MLENWYISVGLRLTTFLKFKCQFNLFRFHFLSDIKRGLAKTKNTYSNQNILDLQRTPVYNKEVFNARDYFKIWLATNYKWPATHIPKIINHTDAGAPAPSHCQIPPDKNRMRMDCGCLGRSPSKTRAFNGAFPFFDPLPLHLCGLTFLATLWPFHCAAGKRKSRF